MNRTEVTEKYNLPHNDARSPYEKRAKIAEMIGSMRERFSRAESNEKEKDLKQAEKHINRLDKFGAKSGKRYKVPVKGTFDYTAYVFAKNDEDAAKLANSQVLSISSSLKLRVSKVGKPEEV